MNQSFNLSFPHTHPFDRVSFPFLSFPLLSFSSSSSLPIQEIGHLMTAPDNFIT
jgi:hypothetical protein